MEISHATQKQKDRDIIVKRLSDGSYAGNVQLDPSKGKYYIVVHDPANSWRLRALLRSCQWRSRLPLSHWPRLIKNLSFSQLITGDLVAGTGLQLIGFLKTLLGSQRNGKCLTTLPNPHLPFVQFWHTAKHPPRHGAAMKITTDRHL